MFGVPVEKHGVNGHLRQKGKIAELALGYGGSVGALKAMGALDMGLEEEELPELVSAWRSSNPNIVRFWWDVDRAVKKAIKEKTTASTHGIQFSCRSGMLFITLPSGRMLSYVKPRMGEMFLRCCFMLLRQLTFWVAIILQRELFGCVWVPLCFALALCG